MIKDQLANPGLGSLGELGSLLYSYQGNRDSIQASHPNQSATERL